MGAGAPLAPAEPPPVATPEAARASFEITPDLQIYDLAPGVWRHVSWHVLDSGVRYPSNGLLVLDGDGLLLIDTAWGEAPTPAESAAFSETRAVMATVPAPSSE